jgi:cytochrome d ubiquinol oxidase subunit II
VSILLGVLAVTSAAYLAAVYLAADAARRHDPELEEAFRLRALGSGVVAGAVAVAGLIVLHADAHRLYHELVAGEGLPALIASGVAGVATLALVYSRRFEAARYTGALAVAAIVAGWTLAQWPTILPGLTVWQAAASHDALVAVVVAVLAGGAIVFPSLALLFRLTLTGQLHGAETAETPPPAGARAPSRPSLLARVAVACLIAGIGLLNIASAQWAHAIGVVSLLTFIVTGFLATVPAALPGDGDGG